MKPTTAFCLALGFVLAVTPVSAQLFENNECDFAWESPDIIIGALDGVQSYGKVGDITGYAIGTESCNIGDCWANWISSTPDHPVIAQNMFRLKDGRFEQIGQSWVKHGFATFDDPLCSNQCRPADGQHLGVNCSDLYWAGLNGAQGSLGPRSGVNPETGEHAHPYQTQGQGGNAIYKRLQVHDADLDPALNAGAEYYVEGQYVAADDADAGNNINNNAFRAVSVSGSNGIWNVQMTASTVSGLPAMYAWRTADPLVAVSSLLGGFIAGHRVTDLGGGTWHYEYAVQNLVSNRAARAFRVPLPHGATVSNIGFHDVDYHSGEPYDGTDWAVTLENGTGPNSIEWSTETFDENPDANAVRWGTMYNFRFDADVGPAPAAATVGLFLPGTPETVAWNTSGPDRCGDAFCESGENEADCAIDCSAVAGAGRVPDRDGAGGTPLLVARGPGSDLDLTWGASCRAQDADYAVYEGLIGDFTSHQPVVCDTGGLTAATIAPGSADRYYVIVPDNGSAEGSYGNASDGSPRPASLAACLPQIVAACP